MLEVLRTGQLDIIGAARPSISDPFLPKKIQEGRLDDIRECIGCNICASRHEQFVALICTQNATAGEEYRRGWHPEKFEPAKNADNDVLVVGAGPAGMECAMILGKRGMRRVHLVEAGDDMGGIMRWIPQLPGLGEWARVVNYRKIQIDKLRNVEFIPNTKLDANGVKEYGAEIVVIATGSHWSGTGLNWFGMGSVPGADATLAHIFTPEQIMDGGKEIPGGPVVVYDCDGYFMGVSLAEKLAKEGRAVTLITPFDNAASYMELTLEAPRMHRLLHSLQVQILPRSLVTRVAIDHVRVEDVVTGYESDEVAAAAIVLVTQREPRAELYQALTGMLLNLQREGVRQLHRIGDCVAPQLVADAIFSGHRLAREIDSHNPSEPLPFIRERPLVAQP
jgi:dimethylamine/trimethylamine dehydrogenase